MDKYKVAVVGLGRIASRHVEAVLRLPETELSAVCDINPQVLSAFLKEHPDVHGYLDYEEMLAKEKLDVVHFCTPHYLHVPHALLAFQKGINVLTEKPMSINYKDAVTAVLEAEKAGCLYGVIFQIRYNLAPKMVKQRLMEGKLGKILSASSLLTWNRTDEYYASSDWKGTWDKEGGGVVIDQAIHSIDLVNWFIDSKASDVHVDFANLGHPSIKVEDTAKGTIDYENGTHYSFFATNNHPTTEPIEIRLICEKGEVVVGYDDAYITYKDGSKEEFHQDPKEHLKDGDHHWYWGYQHDHEIDDYYRCLSSHERFPLDGKESLKTMEIIQSIYDVGRKNFR